MSTGRLVLCWGLAALVAAAEAKPAWSGVDEAVVERIARESGRPPSAPLINTDQGDLLLFLFLVAGAAGGFIAGWSARSLFARKS